MTIDSRQEVADLENVAHRINDAATQIAAELGKALLAFPSTESANDHANVIFRALRDHEVPVEPFDTTAAVVNAVEQIALS